MINRLIGHQYDYGRLYNRTFTANIVARVCGRHAYAQQSNEEEKGQVGNQSYFLTDCLVDFSPQKWKKVMVQFENLRENLLRKDASLLVLPAELNDDNEALEELLPTGDESINTMLESHADFSRGYEEVLTLMKFHTCLSHLQPQLETSIQSATTRGAEPVVIPRANILAFE